MDREARLWKELEKYGITNESELDTAIKKSKPLNLGIMTSTAKKKEKVT